MDITTKRLFKAIILESLTYFVQYYFATEFM